MGFKVFLGFLSSIFLLVIYLVIPVEVFPVKEYSTQSVSIDYYAHSSREEHISLQQEFSTNDGTIRYLDLGNTSGEVIVLIHGTPTSSWMYRKVISDLVSTNKYRVIAIDMLGYGNSDKKKGVDRYSTQKQSARLIQLMDSLTITNWTQVVHDMGGLRTRETLKNHPGRITHLLVLNTVAFPMGFNPPVVMKWLPGLGYSFTKLITVDIFSSLIMTQTIKGMVTQPISQDAIRGYLYPTLQGQWRIYGYFLNSLSQVDEYLESVQTTLSEQKSQLPTTQILRGAKDMILTIDQIDMFKEYRGVQEEHITIVPDASHLIAEDYPELVVEHIEKLLERD